jgi:putative transport protein
LIELVAEKPLLLLFLVTGVGYVLGKLKVGGFSLGISAVLFAGLAASAIDARLKLPEIVYELGLVLFVYTIAVASGPGFVSTLKRRGVRVNLLVLSMIVLAFGLIIAGSAIAGISGERSSGLFAGALTNTPALAGVVEHLKHVDGGVLATEPVVAFSLAYPWGVIGPLLAIFIAQRWWRIDYAKESSAREPTLSRSVLVELEEPISVAAASRRGDKGVVFSRVRHQGELTVPEPETMLARGDVVNVLGPSDAVERVTSFLGSESSEFLPDDRHGLDFRRMFVSRREVVGRTVGELDLPHRHGAMVTRVRRGDVDMVAHDDTVLESGDRVRVVGPRERLGDMSALFGDSYRALAEIDILTFSVGIALGLLLGSISIPLPGGASLELGLAGGSLIVGLIVGAIGRTGPFVWQLPYSTAITLRQFGVVLFLAGIGTRAGDTFATTLRNEGLDIIVVGVFITTLTSLAMLIVGHRVLGVPMGYLIGALAGLLTQPAVLAYATEQAGEELPNLGYAAVYPMAMISKIILAQVLVILLT